MRFHSNKLHQIDFKFKPNDFLCIRLPEGYVDSLLSILMELRRRLYKIFLDIEKKGHENDEEEFGESEVDITLYISTRRQFQIDTELQMCGKKK